MLRLGCSCNTLANERTSERVNVMFPLPRLLPVAHGGAKEMGRVTGEVGQRSCVPLLIEILNSGFHLRHERGERAFSSYNIGGSMLAKRCSSSEANPEQATQDIE